MDNLAVHTPVFGEPADPVSNNGPTSDQASVSSSSTSAVSDLIARHPLLVVTAAGAVALLAIMALRKNSASDGPQKHLACYARFMEKAARREYRRSDISSRIAAMAPSADLSPLVAQALEHLQGMLASKKR